MLGADISMIERFGLFGGERQHLFDARRVRNIADHFLVRAGPDLLFDFRADGVQVEAHFLEHVHRDPLAEFDEAEQQVFGADKVVIEPVSLFPRQRQDLFRARSKVAHGFFAHIYNNFYASLDLSSFGVFDPAGWMTGRRTARSRSRSMSARSTSRSSAPSFSANCLCRCAGCVIINSSSTAERFTSRNIPKSTPSRMSESRFSVSFEEML